MLNNFNKLKIINDPLYGFITIPYGIIFDLIEHPYFQRLRRIKQLGSTNLVYPGAYHTRFHHAIGCLHLMVNAIEVLRSKGIEITDEEATGVCIAILLHDIGHGPFSHALETAIINNNQHEEISIIFMNFLNKELPGKLNLAIEIFKNQYHKLFLHQLVSGQLDMDRLDYLNRDSFFTGVSEGVVSYDRIIKMLNVHNDQLVIEAKGIYSIEKFIIARRLMYWQVYLHKTVLSSEFMLVNILGRARELAHAGQKIFATPALQYFLNNDISKSDFDNPEVLRNFSMLDDYDVHTSIKVWQNDPDKILSDLCSKLVNRRLFKLEITELPQHEKKEEIIRRIQKEMALNEKEARYFVMDGQVTNNAYNSELEKINILFKNGEIRDLAEASDQLNISVLSTPVTKYYLAYPKEMIKN